MLRPLKYTWLVALFIAWLPCYSQAPGGYTLPETADTMFTQPTQDFFIESIIIIGNKKTRDHIILREIPFNAGETYPLNVLTEKFEDARRQLMNTSLFHSVEVSGDYYTENKVRVSVTVKERWYLFPLPFFRPVDRNLNQWLYEKNASLDRVNYGIRFAYNNATGRNDKFRLTLMSGYTRQFNVSYDRLYLDRQMKWGLNAGFGMGKNREVNYNTIGDKQVFVKDDSYLRNFLKVYAELSYRRAIRTRHSFGVAYNVEEVNDTIVSLNPQYFKSGRKNLRVPAIYYNMNYQYLDFIPYPTRGQAAQLSISKTGFNRFTNLWQIHLKAMVAFPLSSRSFVTLTGYAGIKAPFHQPYYNKRFLGYNDVFLQGYEYNVIDGVAGGFLKAAVHRKIFDFKIRIPQISRKKPPEFIPLKIYAKAYGNSGYVHDPEPGENLLQNKMLYSGGIGIDLVTFYDITFRLEWSFNQLGQNGLFLHRKSLY
jgi:outer membrane protein assembly factor BamA